MAVPLPHRCWPLRFGADASEARRPLRVDGNTHQDGATAMLAVGSRMGQRVYLGFPTTRRRPQQQRIRVVVDDCDVLGVVEGLGNAGLRNLHDLIRIHVNTEIRKTQCAHTVCPIAAPKQIFGLTLSPLRTVSMLQRIVQ